jgi:hypothetical protein
MSLRAHAFTQTPGSCGYFVDKDIFLKEVFKQFSQPETYFKNTIF